MKVWTSIFIGVIYFSSGCDPNDSKKHYTQWGRALIDCPTADVSVTWSGENNKLTWNIVEALSITGCGLKICCDSVRDGYSCFPCKKEEWYGKGN